MKEIDSFVNKLLDGDKEDLIDIIKIFATSISSGHKMLMKTMNKMPSEQYIKFMEILTVTVSSAAISQINMVHEVHGESKKVMSDEIAHIGSYPSAKLLVLFAFILGLGLVTNIINEKTDQIESGE